MSLGMWTLLGSEDSKLGQCPGEVTPGDARTWWNHSLGIKIEAMSRKVILGDVRTY